MVKGTARDAFRRDCMGNAGLAAFGMVDKPQDRQPAMTSHGNIAVMIATKRAIINKVR